MFIEKLFCLLTNDKYGLFSPILIYPFTHFRIIYL